MWNANVKTRRRSNGEEIKCKSFAAKDTVKETYHISEIKPKLASKDTLMRGCQKNMRNVSLV
jgi:hypothetical protein